MIRPLASVWEDAKLWRRLAAVLAVLASALFVAALVARPAPDFSALRVVAVVTDRAQRPAWAIRLAPAAHQIAADALRPQPASAGRAYQLWLAGAGKAPHPLGLLPQTGCKVIPVTPENARLMAGAGELLVTLEPAGGSPRQGPTGPVEFRGAFNDS